MATGDLTTLADVEGWLKLSAGNADEALLARLISAASTFAQSWCNRQFAVQPYIEARDGNGNIKMTFGSLPVLSVSSVTISGVSVPLGDAVQSTGYYFTAARLMLNGYRFERGCGNIQLQYTAGFATTPPDVAQAVIEIVAQAYRERDRIGLSSQAIGGETTSYTLKDMPPRAASILSNYRRVAPL